VQAFVSLLDYRGGYSHRPWHWQGQGFNQRWEHIGDDVGGELGDGGAALRGLWWKWLRCPRSCEWWLL
jgi:hypothetical protein